MAVVGGNLFIGTSKVSAAQVFRFDGGWQAINTFLHHTLLTQ
jgi:hypothetical protein